MQNIKLFLVALSIAVTACSADETKLPEAAAVQKAKSHAHASAFPGKPSAPISLDYELLGQPKVGEQLLINVNLRGNGAAAQPVAAKVIYAKQLAGKSAATSSKLVFKANSSKADSQVIAVTPAAEGLFYVTIHASTVLEGQPVHKSFVIPVEIGNVDWKTQLQAQGEIVNDSTGAKVIVMPAQE